MANDNSKQPAFPIDSNDLVEVKTGLSKREYFAGLAMQGLLSNNQKFDVKQIGPLSVQMADALLHHLSKQ
jgi:hypothetical protein